MASSSNIHRDKASGGRRAEVWPHEGVCFVAELEQEEDGRWIADIPELPGVMVYGETADIALAKCEQLARQVLDDRKAHGEWPASA